MKLTKHVCEKAVYSGEGKSWMAIWDEELKGFGLRITPAGCKSYIVACRVHGRLRIFTLGRFGVLSVDQARRMAREKLVEALQGKDPGEERQKAVLGDRMKDLCAAYMEKQSLPHKKSWLKDRQRIDQYILPSLGNCKIESIRRLDIKNLHQRIGNQAPYQANRVLSLCSALFKYAMRIGMTVETFMNPCSGVERFKEKSRDRWVTHEEMPRLWEAIEREPNRYIRAALQLFILTGFRRSELLGLEWIHVNLEQKQIYLGDTKSGRPFYAPLSDLAVDIFRSIPRETGNPFVFCSTQKPGRHVVNITKQWDRIRREAGLQDVRLHDLRRTFGSWLATAGKSLPLIGRALNQSTQQVTAIYARLAMDPIREATQEHAQKILDIVHLRKEKTGISGGSGEK
ncbi:MAG: tyrosine-type recombinase/integrase [bacterium]